LNQYYFSQGKRKCSDTFIHCYKGGFVSELVLPTKGAKLLSWAENRNKFFIVMVGKFKFSAQENDLALFVCNGTKVKIPFEIKPPL
jgi:hypothetical protein